MANGNGQLRVDPTSSNIVGEVNQDSKFLPEFTFNHGRVKTVINTAKDLEDSGYYVSDIPTNLSQCIFILPTFDGITKGSKENNYSVVY